MPRNSNHNGCGWDWKGVIGRRCGGKINYVDFWHWQWQLQDSRLRPSIASGSRKFWHSVFRTAPSRPSEPQCTWPLESVEIMKNEGQLTSRAKSCRRHLGRVQSGAHVGPRASRLIDGLFWLPSSIVYIPIQIQICCVGVGILFTNWLIDVYWKSSSGRRRRD